MWRSNPHKCLFSETCNERVIIAHSVPKNILARLQVNGHVMQPTPRTYKEDTGRAGIQVGLREVGINQASTGSFLCRTHEEFFMEIEDPEADISDIRVLNLMMYRATLKERWTQLRTLESMREIAKVLPFGMEAHPEIRLRANIDIANRLNLKLTQPTRHQDDSFKIKHIVRTIKTNSPILAVAQAGSSSDVTADSRSRQVLSMEHTRNFTGREPNASWTITIIPKEREHVFIASFIEGSLAENFFSHIKQCSGSQLQEAVSAELIKFCENWFVHPTVWNSYGKKRREAIIAAYDNYSDLIEGEYNFLDKPNNTKWHEFLGIPNRHQINLFRY